MREQTDHLIVSMLMIRMEEPGTEILQIRETAASGKDALRGFAQQEFERRFNDSADHLTRRAQQRP